MEEWRNGPELPVGAMQGVLHAQNQDKVYVLCLLNITGPPSGVGSRGTLCDCFLIVGGPILPEPLPGTPMLVGEVGRGCWSG